MNLNFSFDSMGVFFVSPSRKIKRDCIYFCLSE